jgi:hypothetical protein
VQPGDVHSHLLHQQGGSFANRLRPPGRELIEELLVAVHCLGGPRRPEIVLKERRLSQAHDYSVANLLASTPKKGASLNWEFQDVPFRIRHSSNGLRSAAGEESRDPLRHLLSAKLNSTPNAEFQKIVDEYAVIQELKR